MYCYYLMAVKGYVEAAVKYLNDGYLEDVCLEPPILNIEPDDLEDSLDEDEYFKLVMTVKEDNSPYLLNYDAKIFDMIKIFIEGYIAAKENK